MHDGATPPLGRRLLALARGRDIFSTVVGESMADDSEDAEAGFAKAELKGLGS
jgi:hypothetical protein